MIMMMMITQGGLVTFQSDLGRSWAAAWPPILPDKILNTHHTREDHGKDKYKIQKKNTMSWPPMLPDKIYAL